VFELRAEGPESDLREVVAGLRGAGAIAAASLLPTLDGDCLLLAEVEASSADDVIQILRRGGLDPGRFTLARREILGAEPMEGAATLVWTDLVGRATDNARLLRLFIALMSVAGVVAAFGVIYDNVALIVGAMAISPDLLPITAIVVGLVGGRFRLAGQAAGTLAVGFIATCLCGAAITAVLDPLDLLPAGFEVGASALSGLTSVNVGTIGVALAAGVAAMLAVETRAAAAVGVAISITTIPAAAYLGVAAGEGDAGRVVGAVGVLSTNVAMLVLAGSVTLLAQRRGGGNHPDRARSPDSGRP
jgi:uncharacterized hydrophobic protein (TIGR00271 family)